MSTTYNINISDKYLWIGRLEYVRKTMDFWMYTLGYKNGHFLKGNVVSLLPISRREIRTISTQKEQLVSDTILHLFECAE